MENLLFWLVPVASIVALLFARYFYVGMMKESEGTEQMAKIASHVRVGAMSYLRQQYKIVGIVFIVLAIVFSIMAYGFQLQNAWVPVAFLTGGFFSGLAGYLGMRTATNASARTANAARQSLNGGLRVAFRSGAVMGLVVVGLGLLDISFWYIILDYFVETTGPQKLTMITTTMLTFGMGASTQALFARVGGGIYTKAADVGADLVGKVEAGIPEDDPRNPATIADNVGDNVGDVAGMGADLYESYCGSILATAALGAAAFMTQGDEVMQFKAVLAPMLIAAVGILLSIVGIFSVRTKEDANMRQLLGALSFGTNLSSVLIVGATFLILWALGITNWALIGCAVVVGLIVGIVIGRATEYYTSQSYKPTQKLSESGTTGPATVIISGIGLGMVSTAVPVLAVVCGIILSYWFASGFDFTNVGMGLYGIGIAAVGMLSTLGITLATDAYGHIDDNAGGNAEMSGVGRSVGAWRICAPSHGRSRFLRQHHSRDRQGICHRFGRPYRSRPACILHRRDSHRYRPSWRDIYPDRRQSRGYPSGHIHRFHDLFRGESHEPEGAFRHVYRSHDGIPLLRIDYECRRPCRRPYGGGGASAVPSDKRHP